MPLEVSLKRPLGVAPLQALNHAPLEAIAKKSCGPTPPSSGTSRGTLRSALSALVRLLLEQQSVVARYGWVGGVEVSSVIEIRCFKSVVQDRAKETSSASPPYFGAPDLTCQESSIAPSSNRMEFPFCPASAVSFKTQVTSKVSWLVELCQTIASGSAERCSM